MSDCLLTKLPVAVGGNREKLGKIFIQNLKDNGGENPDVFSMHFKFSAPFYISWNNTTTSYPTGTSPRRIPPEGDSYDSIACSWTTRIGYTPEQSAAWADKYTLTGIDITGKAYIPQNTGFEWMIESSDSPLDYLDVFNLKSIDDRRLYYPRVKVLKIDGSHYQPYEAQKLLDNCPNLVYIMFHERSNSSTANNNTINYYKLLNVVYPDNIKYIRNCPTRPVQLSANCEELSLQDNLTGSLNDFINKAVASGRRGGELSFYKGGISSSLTMKLTPTSDAIKVSDRLTAKNITGSYFKLTWSTDENNVTTCDLEPADSQLSLGITYNNYTRLLE